MKEVPARGIRASRMSTHARGTCIRERENIREREKIGARFCHRVMYRYDASLRGKLSDSNDDVPSENMVPEGTQVEKVLVL